MAAHAVTEATPAGEVDGLSPRRKAVPLESLLLVPLAAFRGCVRRSILITLILHFVVEINNTITSYSGSITILVLMT